MEKEIRERERWREDDKSGSQCIKSEILLFLVLIMYEQMSDGKHSICMITPWAIQFHRTAEYHTQ